MTSHRTLKDVRRELKKARMADVVAVQLSLKNFWKPWVLFRAVTFIFKNRKRQSVLARMEKARMGFDWRCSLPKKKQRQLGMLPPINSPT